MSGRTIRKSILVLAFLLGLGSQASVLARGAFGPIVDHHYDATLLVVRTGNAVWPPVAVDSLAEYLVVYGSLDGPDVDYGRLAAELFFANGGQVLYVIDPQGNDPGDFENALELSADLPVSLVAMPSAACCQEFPLVHAAIMNVLVAHAAQSANRFALVDAPRNSDSSALLAYRSSFSSQHAALYAPWLQIPETIGSSQLVDVPPSAAVAGVISRIDRESGIFETPAGLDAELMEPPMTSLERDLSASQDTLNPAGINLLREFDSPPDILVWGGRTLFDEPLRRYIASARFMRHLEYSISRSLAGISELDPGAVNPAVIDLLIEDYLEAYWLQGAMTGDTPEQAYFVSCSNAPPFLNCAVGVAMFLPSEFDLLILNLPYRDALFHSRFEP